MKRYLTALTLVLLAAGVAGAGTTDVMFVVDESGSMAGEHAWITNMVTQLDSALVGAGITGNRYALVSFGDNVANSGDPLKFSVGGGDWGSAADLSAAASTLYAYGGVEDGYEAMDFGLNPANYTWRAGAVKNIILITDEDRDVTTAQTYTGMLNALDSAGALLNVVVNHGFAAGGVGQLGVSDDGTPYAADGAGGYIKGTAGTGVATTGFVTTKADYIDLAWATAAGGAAWDLNQLRAGGFTAQSFTAAFVDVKVEEVIERIPAPGAFLLGGLGVSLVGWMRRRRLCA